MNYSKKWWQKKSKIICHKSIRNETKNQVIKYINENIPRIHAINPEATFMVWLDCRDLGFKTQKELKDFM